MLRIKNIVIVLFIEEFQFTIVSRKITRKVLLLKNYSKKFQAKLIDILEQEKVAELFEKSDDYSKDV